MIVRSVSWPEYLRSRGASPGTITQMTVGGDATDLSALYVLRQFAMLRRSTQRYKIAGGMDLLPRAMASALGNVVRYNAPVVRVTRDPAAGFRVEYRADDRVERLAASRVIFAIPFTTLRDIEIRPRLGRRSRPSRSCPTMRARGSCCRRAAASGDPPT
jgi:monoamine oxidase